MTATLTPPNPKPTILELLGYTQDEFEKMKLNRYLNWAISFTVNHGSDLQRIIANRAVGNFFNEQWAKCETEFITELSLYPSFDTKTNLQHFGRCLVQLHNRYPKGIIEQTKNLNIINELC